jgi:GT2 family glycosyltransferase
MAGVFQVKPDADAAYCGQYLYRGSDREPFAVRFGCYNPALLCNRNYIDLNCFVHRRDVLEGVGGGFCEEIRRWVDYELILRISRACKIYSVPILQSNYFMEHVENAITDTEELQPARDYILSKWGYDNQVRSHTGDVELKRKVAVIVPGHGAREYTEACIDALTEDFRRPTVEILVVADASDPEAAGRPGCLGHSGVKTIFSTFGSDLFDAVDAAVKVADPESDLLVLDPNATLSTGALPALQKAAYEEEDIAMVLPQQVRPGGDPAINIHVPYAFNDLPCDIALSNHHRNVEALSLLHGGGSVELNYASFFCAYIKRDVWDACCGSIAGQGQHHQPDHILCEFVRHVLGKRIVYFPDAVAMHRASAGSKP